MGARLLILIAVAIGLGVFLVTRSPKSGSNSDKSDRDAISAEESGITEEQRSVLDITNKALEQRDLPGEEPNPRPTLSDFSVRTETNTAAGKYQLCFYITEKHGYYVETFRIKFWYAGKDGKLSAEESPFARYQYINHFLKANDTLKYCMELAPVELNLAGGSIGESLNWAARVEFFHRSRVSNPDPLPILAPYRPSES